jgi:hypothetical protein
VNYKLIQYVGRCDHCGARPDRRNGRRTGLGPADVVTGRAGARLCTRCWWRANRNGWTPEAEQAFIERALEVLPGSREL